MKCTTFTAALCLLLTVNAFAQSDVEAITASIQKGFEAVTKQDWKTLDSLCTDDYTMMSDVGQRWDRTALQAFLTEHMTEHKIAITDIDVHVAADATMAWATMSESTQYKFDGNPVDQQAIFTAILEKADGLWKMRLLHRSVAPPTQKMTEKE